MTVGGTLLLSTGPDDSDAEFAKPARGGACFVPHLLIPPKSCIAFIADSSELARVEVVQQCFFPLPQTAQMSHIRLNGAGDFTSTRELLSSGVRSLLQLAAVRC